MKPIKQKLYCYVDETGQDTQGALFVVSVAVTKEDREDLRELLAKLEKTTGKGKTKWVRTRKEFKIAYLEKILTQKDFRHKIFFSLSKETKTYREITLITIASAITASKDVENYEALVFIDGLQKSEINDAKWVKVQDLSKFAIDNKYNLNSNSHKKIIEIAKFLKLFT